ncbi:hypothetical protein ACWEO9_14110, partial [Streptomyces albidoflavus]
MHTTGSVTHEVTNQAPPLTGHDVADDPVLLEGVRREGAAWHLPELHRFGRYAGSEEAQHRADQANRHEPELRTHDRYGHRVDEVEFHPAYHALIPDALALQVLVEADLLGGHRLDLDDLLAAGGG